MSYGEAKKKYAKIGVDTEKAIRDLKKIPISMHCWQGDDVNGFERGEAASGGIQTTGNYPGKARNFAELTQDLEFALGLIPGTSRVNVHAIYSVPKAGRKVERDMVGPQDFEAWIKWAKKVGVKLDFNSSCFSHPMAADGMTLAHPDKKVRDFWIRHTAQCLKIAEYIGKAQKSPCSLNLWMPDGLKDEPSDRLGPRLRMADSLDKALATKYDRKWCVPTLESKLFGIGLESYTVSSHEFAMGYALSRGILALLDMGHFHISENVADKISSFLMFFGKVAFHISRPVRWDSDHVIRQNDDLRNAAQEIVRMGPENFLIALDYFDASINRIAAWVLGMRNMQKELLKAMLTPQKALKAMQDRGAFTAQLVCQEEYKNYPFEAVWEEYCRREGVPANESWLAAVEKYEKDVLLKRA